MALAEKVNVALDSGEAAAGAKTPPAGAAAVPSAVDGRLPNERCKD